MNVLWQWFDHKSFKMTIKNIVKISEQFGAQYRLLRMLQYLGEFMFWGPTVFKITMVEGNIFNRFVS